MPFFASRFATIIFILCLKRAYLSEVCIFGLIQPCVIGKFVLNFHENEWFTEKNI